MPRWLLPPDLIYFTYRFLKLDEQINEIAASYKLEGAKLKEMMGEREKEQIREDLKVQAAIDLLVEQAKLA